MVYFVVEVDRNDTLSCQFRSWSYAAMERFPSLERERERSSSAGPGALQHPVKLPDYNHTAEVIFAFPSLQLHLKSEQWQGGSLPSLTGKSQLRD